MFRFPKRDFAYIFTFSRPRKEIITMDFVFFPIDVVFLDKNARIIELVETLRPFSKYFPSGNIICFIELPAGSIARHKLKIGQKLSWSNDSLILL